MRAVVKGYRPQEEIDAEREREEAAERARQRAIRQAEHEQAADACRRLASSGRPPDCMIEVEQRRSFWSSATCFRPLTPAWFLGYISVDGIGGESTFIHGCAYGQDGRFYVAGDTYPERRALRVYQPSKPPPWGSPELTRRAERMLSGEIESHWDEETP